MSALLSPEHPEAPLFSDGIGDRVVSADGATGELVQILRIHPSLTAVPSFDFALRERAARLANFRHACYARVRRVDRAPGHPTALSVISDHVEGTRLSDILRVAAERGLHLDTNAALCLIRQLVPAVALLHENARDVAHGLIAPERLIVTPQGRLVIAEHVLGAAVEQMQYGRERFWHEFRVAMPPSAGIPRFDQRSDVAGIGVVALSLVLGRSIATDEYPGRLNDLLNAARERTAFGDEQPLSAPLRSWLARALQTDVRRAFASAPETLAALEQLTAGGSTYVAAPVALETFLSRYAAALLSPPAEAAPAPPALASWERELPEIAEVPAPFVAAVALEAPMAIDAPQTPQAPLPTEALFLDDVWTPDAPWTPEPVAAAAPAHATPAPYRRKTWFAAAAALIVLGLGGYAGLRAFSRTPAPAMATLAVQSNPAGVPIFVDGIERGVTPATVTLQPGAHILELRGRGVPRVIPVTLAAGAEVSQYLEFSETPIAGDVLATVAAVPAAAPVAVRPVETSAAPLAGWITVKTPFVVEIHEGGRLLGTTESDRLMLAAGKHQIELVNPALGYRTSLNVQVTAGKVTPLVPETPRGSINLNASPWAEVWIDGQRAGETPIGNFPLPIGPHEIVFRHPQLGEKRHAVSVVAGSPVRLSVDMK